MDRLPSQRFKKSERLCSRRAIETLFGSGSRSLAAYPLRAVYRRAETSEPVEVLVSVAKRHLRRAVDRNRAKRQIREAYRRNKYILWEALRAADVAAAEARSSEATAAAVAGERRTTADVVGEPLSASACTAGYDAVDSENHPSDKENSPADKENSPADNPAACAAEGDSPAAEGNSPVPENTSCVPEGPAPVDAVLSSASSNESPGGDAKKEGLHVAFMWMADAPCSSRLVEKRMRTLLHCIAERI